MCIFNCESIEEILHGSLAMNTNMQTKSLNRDAYVIAVMVDTFVLQRLEFDVSCAQ